MTLIVKVLIAALVVAVLVAVPLGFFAGRLYSPVSRSAVYEIPLGKNTPWKVTSYRDEIYVLIKAPAMPEEEKK